MLPCSGPIYACPHKEDDRVGQITAQPGVHGACADVGAQLGVPVTAPVRSPAARRTTHNLAWILLEQSGPRAAGLRAVVAEDVTWTRGGPAASARRPWPRPLPASGSAPGDIVLLRAPDSPEWIATFLGAVRCGAVVALAGMGITGARLADVAARATPRLVISDGPQILRGRPAAGARAVRRPGRRRDRSGDLPRRRRRPLLHAADLGLHGAVEVGRAPASRHPGLHRDLRAAHPQAASRRPGLVGGGPADQLRPRQEHVLPDRGGGGRLDRAPRPRPRATRDRLPGLRGQRRRRRPDLVGAPGAARARGARRARLVRRRASGGGGRRTAGCAGLGGGRRDDGDAHRQLAGVVGGDEPLHLRCRRQSRGRAHRLGRARVPAAHRAGRRRTGGRRRAARGRADGHGRVLRRSRGDGARARRANGCAPATWSSGSRTGRSASSAASATASRSGPRGSTRPASARSCWPTPMSSMRSACRSSTTTG